MTLPHDVRRAERCIGLAVRKGQVEGRIAKRGQGGGNAPGAKGDRCDRGISLPSQFVTHNDLADSYAMTDNVTDEEFEKAVEVSR